MTQGPPYCCVCGCYEVNVIWPAQLPPRIDSIEFSYAGNKMYHGEVVRCRSCGHLFVYPLPVDSQKLYSQVVDEFYLKMEGQRRRTFEAFLDLKEQFCPTRGALLDVGCSTGIFLQIAALRGYRAEGIELSKWAVGIAQGRRLNVRNISLEDLADMNKFYDTITAFDVIEHMADPLKALILIRSQLREGGCFVATVPDMNTWHARLFGRHHWLVVLMHFHYFTRRTFSRLLKRSGFLKFHIVSAPPYRIRFKDAAGYFECHRLLKYFFVILSRFYWIKNLEIRLKASLFCVAWK